MKTANDLFFEYYNKSPMERIHLTLQDHVFNHQQAKIDAMKKQLIDVQRKLNSISIDEIRPRHSEYDHGWRDCSKTILDDLRDILK